MSTEKKVAVITGASSGIGAGILQAFRDRNYRVVATSRSIKPVADEDVVTVQGDVAARDTAERVFKAALERFGRVDTLVNNAGLFMARPFVLYSQADYVILIGTHVAGFFHMTQCALELMYPHDVLVGDRLNRPCVRNNPIISISKSLKDARTDATRCSRYYRYFLLHPYDSPLSIEDAKVHSSRYRSSSTWLQAANG